MTRNRNCQRLREGFTTGTAAAAAAKAALTLLATGQTPTAVDVPLPPLSTGGRLTVPVASVVPDGGGARATIVKDGGDDPDATHGAAIECLARLRDDALVTIDGGRGVGRVTLPGLPVAVGRAAINPAPLAQIEAAAREALPSGQGADLLIEVPDGETRARKTLNPRLGIVGGISILGTSGIVKPFSHAAWEAAVMEALDVARAVGLREIWLTTGRASERSLRAERPDLPETAMVQAADHFHAATAGAAERGFGRVTWRLFFGKLVKQAMGLRNTHAKTAPVDFEQLAKWLSEAGMGEERVSAIRNCVTARGALDIMRGSGAFMGALSGISLRALRHMRRFAGVSRPVVLAIELLDYDGELIQQLEDGGDASE